MGSERNEYFNDNPKWIKKSRGIKEFRIIIYQG
jgi:hypothetical protein